MKIAMVVTNNIIDDVRVFKEAKLLSELGHDIHVFGVGDKEDNYSKSGINIHIAKDSSLSLLRKKNLKNIKQQKNVIPSDSTKKNNIFKKNMVLYVKFLTIYFILKSREYILWKSIKKKKIKFDVIHCHDLDTLAIGVKFKKRKLINELIFDSHEYWTEMSGINSMISKIYKKKEQRYFNELDYFITVSNEIGNRMVQSYNSALTPVILRNIPDFIETTNIDNSLNKKILKIVYSGFYQKGRGIEDIIENFVETNKYIYLDLILPDNKEDNLFLNSLILKNDLQDRVKIKSFVPQDQLIALLQSYDIGILPYQPVSLNNYLCLPNKIFQYMSAGLPILSNDLPEVKYIIEKYDCGWIYKNDNFSQLINSIYENRMSIDLKNMNVLVAIKTNLNWQTESKKLLSIYGEINGK